MKLKMEVIGYIGQDAYVNQLNGNDVLNFSVAHTEKFTSKETGELKEKTTWVSCSYWSKFSLANLKQYMTAGTLVAVEGTPSVRIYTNKNGEEQAALDLRVDNIILLSTKKTDDNVAEAPKKAAAKKSKENKEVMSTELEAADDLPF